MGLHHACRRLLWIKSHEILTHLRSTKAHTCSYKRSRNFNESKKFIRTPVKASRIPYRLDSSPWRQNRICFQGAWTLQRCILNANRSSVLHIDPLPFPPPPSPPGKPTRTACVKARGEETSAAASIRCLAVTLPRSAQRVDSYIRRVGVALLGENGTRS